MKRPGRLGWLPVAGVCLLALTALSVSTPLSAEKAGDEVEGTCRIQGKLVGGKFQLVGATCGLMVTVTDRDGKPAPGVPVHFYVTGDPAKPKGAKKEKTVQSAFLIEDREVQGEATVPSGSDGVATVEYRLGSKKGDYVVLASVDGLAGKPAQFKVEAGKIPIIIITMLGGLGMFIFGMNLMGAALQKWAGQRMKSVLGFFTKNRVVALLSGVVITFVLQSSSATTVLLVGFVNSGLMTMAQTIGVILGADIGTTLTVQLIAFDVGQYALAFVFLGFVFSFFFKGNKACVYLGRALLGFGLLFYGLKVMGGSMKPLAQYQPFVDLLQKSVSSPIMGLLVSTVLTAFIQSSAATIAIGLGLASQGLITIDQAIPIIFGANIGTTITAALACIGTTRSAKRVAMAHTQFKVAGVILFMCFGTYLGIHVVGRDFLALIVTKIGGSITRQIANAHTIFNVFMAALFLPFSHLFAAFVMKVLPEKEKKGEAFKPIYLASDLTNTPGIALEQTAKEVARAGDVAVFMNDNIMECFRRKAPEFVERLIQENRKIVILEEAIRPYLARIGAVELTNAQSKRGIILMNVTNEYRETGHVIADDILPYSERFIQENLFFSPEGWKQLNEFHAKVSLNVRDAARAFKEGNTLLAQEVTERKPTIVRLEKEFTRDHFARLSKGLKESVETSTLHAGIISGMRRVNSFATNIAYAVLGQV